MKKTVWPFLILFLTVWLGPVSAAQEEQSTGPLTVTLDQAIDMALGQNPFHRAALETEDQARARVRGATAKFFPSLNGQGTSTLAEKLMILEFPSMIPGEPPQKIALDFTRDFQSVFSLSAPVFTGGQLLSGYKQAKYNLQSTREGIRRSEHETVFNVKSAFYGYLLAKEFLDVAKEALSLAERHYENVEDLYEVGLASKFDLLRSEVQAANLKPQLIRAENGLIAAELGLKTVMSVEPETPLVVEGELSFDPVEVDVESAVAEAGVNRPELKQVDFQLKMAGQMVKMSRGAFLPSLAIGGTFNFWGDKLNFKNWSNYYSINLVLTIPIFNGLENHARLAESRAAFRQMEWTKKGLTESVELEVRQTYLNYKQAKETLSSQEKNVEQAREAVRLAELNYQEGLATNRDVTSAQVALSQARTNYSQAVYDCVISLASLDRAIGRGRTARS